MIRRIAIAAFMLIMAPAFAFAGTFSIAVSGSGGSVGPTPLSGYASAAKVFTATATTGYTLSSVTDNSVNVTTNSAYVTGSGPWTVTIPLSSSSQTFYVSFKQNVQVAPTLSAVLPSAITIPAATATALSGGNSTIANLQTGTQATFTFAGTGLTFSPASGQVTSPINITTNVTAAVAGTYTGTLTRSQRNWHSNEFSQRDHYRAGAGCNCLESLLELSQRLGRGYRLCNLRPCPAGNNAVPGVPQRHASIRRAVRHLPHHPDVWNCRNGGIGTDLQRNNLCRLPYG